VFLGKEGGGHDGGAGGEGGGLMHFMMGHPDGHAMRLVSGSECFNKGGGGKRRGGWG
jgi:hypothetical protein